MTIKDIAKAAGVAPSTVSKVINQNYYGITEETRQKVLKVIEESKYVPYAGVRGRLLAQNNQIALVLPSLRDPFFACFADKIQSLARNQGYTLTIQSSFCQIENEEAILAELSDAYIAGLLFFPQSEESTSFLQSDDSNIGCTVLLDSTYPNLPVPQLSRDFTAAAENGTAYLLKNNHRRIALILSGGISKSTRDRVLSGYKAALSSTHLAFDDQLVLTAEQNLDFTLGNLIDSGIDAILCQDGASVGDAYRILSKKQYRVPEDISVLCLEDSPLLQQLSPAVTAISSDADELARLAMEALLSQLSGGQTTAFTSNLPVQLHRRDSVRRLEKPEHKIVIAGSINMDITLNMSHVPHLGETVLASSQSSWPGGKGANQAIGVSRFGGDAFMIGRLGSDVYGKQLFEHLTNAQIDMQGVSYSQDQLSGTAFINVQGDGQNTIVVNPGANASVTPEYIEKNRFIFSDAQYCLVQMEIPLETVVRIVRICKEYDVKVILKPSPAQPLPSDVLEDLFLLIPNQEESCELFPEYITPEEQAQAALKQGVENVIITLGDKGCLFADRNGSRVYPAMDYPCVDATGASDIFISCLAAQLSKGRDMDTAIKLATIAASYSVSKEGVQNAIIDSDILLDLYNGDYSLSATTKE